MFYINEVYLTLYGVNFYQNFMVTKEVFKYYKIYNVKPALFIKSIKEVFHSLYTWGMAL